MKAVTWEPTEGMTPLEATCYRYLEGLPYLVFADWDISNEGSRIDAARWLAKQIDNIHFLLATGEVPTVGE